MFLLVCNLFSHRLNELEEKTRKQESRPEDIQLISCLQDKLSEREELIKQLVVRFPSTYTYILRNLLEGSIQCFTRCFWWILSFCSAILWKKCMFLYQRGTRNFLFHQEGRKFHHSLLANTESYRNRSFSFNPTQGCLTPSTKVR